MGSSGGARPVISYCARCRGRIEPTELDAGPAMSADNRTLCRGCREAEQGVSNPVHKPRMREQACEPSDRSSQGRPDAGSRRDRPIGQKSPSMVMIGLAIIAAGGLALTAFILFSVMGVGGRDRVAARSAGNGSGGAPNGALERQRAIEEKIDSARAATVKAKEQSGAGQKDSAKGDFQRGPEDKNPDVVPDPGPGAARVLDASDTRSISGSAGKTVTISGRVSSCTWSSSGKVLFVNFSSDRSSFYAVMFKNREKDFLDEFGSPPDKRLAGRSVEITGRVEMYEGRPQIKLEKPGQVKFVD